MFETDEELAGDRRITNWQTKRETAVDRFDGGEPEPQRPEDPLDSDASTDLFLRCLGHYFRELDRQTAERERMEADQDMADHIQWTEEEVAALEERGQTPLTFNVVKTSLEWVIGTQRRAPMDYKILPRSKDGLQHAERKTQLLKHLSDVYHFPRHVTRAFSDAVTVGVGWLETGHQADEEGEPVYERYESWRNMLWDTTAIEEDLSDARYIIRTKWTDRDIAEARFSKRRELIQRSVESVWEAGPVVDGMGDPAMDSQEEAHFDAAFTYVHANANAPRERVRLFEAWFKRPVPTKIIRGGDFNGEVFDEWSEGHVASVNAGSADVVTRPRERMFVAIFTGKGLLYLAESPYRHNRYPFTPVWGYRRGRDGMPYGMVRGLRDIQRDLNKRASKTLWHLSASRIYIEEGSVDDVEETRIEGARADAVLVYKQGRQPPKIETDFNLANAHADLMARDIQMIQQVGGVTDENMGRSSNATSGKAIVARQQQGELSTSNFFENLRFARIIHGEKVLSNIEQFYTETKKFRITNARGNPEYVGINDPETEDDDAITRTKADFIVDEEDWRATVRQAQVDALFEVMQALAATHPQLVASVLDLLVEMMDLPKRDEIVKRIRQITGVTDPDADPNNPDPETEAMMAQKAKQQAMQERAIEAEVTEKEAKAIKTKAEAEAKMAAARKALADLAKAEASLPSEEIANLNAALDAASKVIGTPGIGAVADTIRAHAEAAMQGAPAEPVAQQADAIAPPPPAPEPGAAPQPGGPPVPQQ